MKSQYARVMSSRYAMIHDHNTPVNIRYLYMYVYPMIYTSVRRGLTDVTLKKAPPRPVMDQLIDDGFQLYHKTDSSDVTIDWAGAKDIKWEDVGKLIL